jgi:excisionase family DNA binding protein
MRHHDCIFADYSATDYSHHYMGSSLQNLEKRMSALTIGEVAELLRVSDDTLRRQVKRREIPFFRVGMQIRFDPQRLADWLKHREIIPR